MRPRLGFLGLGWIGRRRLASVVEAETAEVVCIADPSADALDAASTLVPDAIRERTLDALLRHDLDGVVIATPSGMHLRQVVQVLEHGNAVFCQKPLALTADEASRIVQLAQERDRLVSVDMSYRHAAAMRRLRESVVGGELGKLVSVDLTFHNAYGPDKGVVLRREHCRGRLPARSWCPPD